MVVIVAFVPQRDASAVLPPTPTGVSTLHACVADWTPHPLRKRNVVYRSTPPSLPLFPSPPLHPPSLTTPAHRTITSRLALISDRLRRVDGGDQPWCRLGQARAGPHPCHGRCRCVFRSTSRAAALHYTTPAPLHTTLPILAPYAPHHTTCATRGHLELQSDRVVHVGWCGLEWGARMGGVYGVAWCGSWWSVTAPVRVAPPEVIHEGAGLRRAGHRAGPRNDHLYSDRPRATLKPATVPCSAAPPASSLSPAPHATSRLSAPFPPL